ncbi:MAG: alpha/beta fold hydrolase [Nitrospiraceae bacterium]|nr:MAG: alpha/beta fold hydrolase [Nitrospiraceae bacterium]
MKRFVVNTVKGIVKALLSGTIGAFIVLVTVFVLRLESRQELKVWHTAELDEEFTAENPVKSFEGYLALEDRLFAQLGERVLDRVRPEDRRRINRFHRGSLSDPGQWPRNWNRTFELSTDAPEAGVLLLHGMSDSPYSLRSIGQHLHDSGTWVVGLRLPGHGTAPSGLVDVRYEDMAAAVRLAVRHLRDKVNDRPLYIVGYSNGAALAIQYVLLALEDTTLPQVNKLVLISPSIGVTKIAALAVWQARLGHFLGLDKLAWQDIQPEYDPFKYSSFAVNAGDQVYRLTNEIRSSFKKPGTSEKLSRFPPVLAFQSVVDATVSTRAVVQILFKQLPEGGHELVLFDINRVAEIETVLTDDPKEDIEAVISDTGLSFVFSLITNAGSNSRDIVLRQKKPSQSGITEISLGMKWPRGIYSLSHVALPFSVKDSLYGRSDSADGSKLQLGNMDFRGERGALQIPASAMLRLRWNPFYPYIEQRLLEFLKSETD